MTINQENVLFIKSNLLEVKFNLKSSCFSISSNNKGEFVKKLKLNADKNPLAKIENIKNDVFGSGQSIMVTYENCDQDILELYHDVPFVFLKSVKANVTNEKIVLNKVEFLNFEYFSEKGESLQAFGSGGNFDLENDPGSFLFEAVVNPIARNGMVCGFLTNDKGSGSVFAKKCAKGAKIKSRLEYGKLTINPSENAESETFVLGYFEDARLGLEEFADLIKKHYNIVLNKQLSGYCTWYSDVSGKASNEKMLPKLIEVAGEKLKDFGFDMIQIDDFWQEGVRDNGPKKVFLNYNKEDGPFKTLGMKDIADKIKEHNFVAGLWLIPFGGNYKDPYFADKQDLFAKNPNGTPYDTRWGGTCLDMTNPEARAYLTNVIDNIVNNWGFKYLKLDGLYTGLGVNLNYVSDCYKKDDIGKAKFYDTSKTNVEAYRSGLQLVRDAAGKDTFILGCCTLQNMRSFAGSIGLVDAMRIGPDNVPNALTKWDGFVRGPKYGARNYFFNKRIWYNDPDPIYVRNNGKVPINAARSISSWASLMGQLTVNSDWIPKLPNERVNILKRVFPAHDLTNVRPVDLFERAIPRMCLLTDTTKNVRRDVIGCFNFEDKQFTTTETLERIGLSKDTEYEAFEFWSNKYLGTIKNSLKLTLKKGDCKIIAVREVSKNPIVISTSRHITQGIIDILNENYDSTKKILSSVSKVVANDPYELRIVNKSDLKVKAINAEGLKTSFEQKDDLLRVQIFSTENKTIKWEISFK